MSWPATNAELEAMGQEIVANGAGAFTGYDVAYGDLTVTAQLPHIVEALSFLRDAQGFQQLVDLAGADYPERERRFDVVYHLLSMTRNRRVRIKVQTDEDTPVPSIVAGYPGAVWYEREAFDMYGIFLEGHPDLRR
uniref:complex I 30 kDa subunit family protein n=1 Tax=Phenylobacterium sp. TaxID=1871053 RepID=UPI00398346CE